MRQERIEAAGAHDSRHGLVITGGRNSTNLVPISSAEKTTDGENFHGFPSLPIPLIGHCLVSLQNNGGLFSTGGIAKDEVRSGTYLGSGRSFIYDVSSNTWDEVDALPTGIYSRESRMMRDTSEQIKFTALHPHRTSMWDHQEQT